MQLDVSQSCVVTITGEADLYAAAGVEQELTRLIHDGYTRIVVDLTGATFIDSTMLRVLLNVSKRLKISAGELLVVCGEPSVRRIFQVTLLDRVFTIYETRDEALAHLQRVDR